MISAAAARSMQLPARRSGYERMRWTWSRRRTSWSTASGSVCTEREEGGGWWREKARGGGGPKMGNKKPSSAEKKHKKKGRPSLLDLQKRSLRLQSPNPNPPSSRRTTRRNPNPDPSSDEDDGRGSAGRREKKKIKLVHRIPDSNDDAASESDKEEKNNSKAKDAQGEPSDSGPTTPLPDKKLLVFILDRLQKKDTYGVFSEPVDPEELPDYHEIIEHPMDFGTVRKKLSGGAYTRLEQFEEDVFLISSNAMCYNSEDTIYYRQARAILELAKKNFENLRQESDDDETEAKTVVRKGRPPSKNIKPAVGRASVDRAASDFSSEATLANAGEGVQWSNLTNDLSRKGPASKKASAGDVSARATYNLRNIGPYNWTGIHKSENNEDYPGNASRGISAKYGKKLPIADENRRNTYYQPQPSTFGREPSILTTFDSEKKHLMPHIGLQLEHSYAWSLARFAANLGPIGWTIAAKKIERILPPGTKYGRGWIGGSEDPHQSQQSILSSTPPTSSQPNTSLCTRIPQSSKVPERLESSSSDLATGVHSIRTMPPVPTSSASNKSPASVEVGSEPTEGLDHEGGSNPPGGVCGLNNNIQFNSPFHLHQNAGLPPNANGHTSASGFSLPSHVGNTGRPVQSSGPFGSEAPMTHARALDMVSRKIFNNNNPSIIHQMPKRHVEAEKGKLVSSSGTISSGSIFPDRGLGKDFQGSWRSLSQQPKLSTIPPDLNVRFHSPGSPAPSVIVESQQPDLALQL